MAWTQSRLALAFGVAAATLALAAACGGDEDALDGAFALEARYEVTNPSEGTTVSGLRWWYEPEGRWRWEIARDEADAYVLGISDGETWTSYDADSDAYEEQPLPAELAQPWIPVSLPVGPIGDRDIDALLDRLRERLGSFATVSGSDFVLGRQTLVIEYGPAYGSSTLVESSSGTLRMWLDPERMLILRHELDAAESAAETYAIVQVTGWSGIETSRTSCSPSSRRMTRPRTRPS